MLRTLSDEEMTLNKEKLKKFCEDNHCDMYNYMNSVRQYRYEGEQTERERIIKIIQGLSIPTPWKKAIVNEIKAEERKKLDLLLKKYGGESHE